MTNVHRIATRDALEEAASSWIARLEADDVDDADRQRFTAWLDEDPHHRETFEAMRHSWHRLDALAALANGKGATNTDSPESPARPKRLAAAWAIAATVLLLAGATAFWQLRAPAVLQYETAIGHHLSVSLEDGSSIDLNTNTLIEVNYTDTERTVQLQRGEAHFDVEKDPARPFVVLAGSGAVRAVGTQFNVYLADNFEVEVTVTEGIVEVTQAEELKSGSPALREIANSAAPARVGVGQRIHYDQQFGAVGEIPTPQLERRLAWRQGMLSFDGETLEEVVVQVSRYTNIEFVIADPDLRALQVGGYFKSTDVTALTDLLDTAFQVDVRRDGQKIHLTRRSP